jgi:hypothetical protein
MVKLLTDLAVTLFLVLSFNTKYKDTYQNRNIKYHPFPLPTDHESA